MAYPYYQATFYLDDLPPGTTYEMAAAALRDELEQDSPDALNWSPVLDFTTTEDPRNVRASATHDTLSVSWDAQQDGDSYIVTLTGPEGGKQL